MFTGIVEGVGRVISFEALNGLKRLVVDTSALKRVIPIGGSLSINGCCTTAIYFNNNVFKCELIDATLQKTNLGSLAVGDEVNLEQPLKLGDELSGHLVQGHIDCTGDIVNIEEHDGNRRLIICCNRKWLKFVVETGSVAVNGVSLTVIETKVDSFVIGIIPHTWEITNFKYLKLRSKVNLEFDIIGKYLEKLYSQTPIKSN